MFLCALICVCVRARVCARMCVRACGGGGGGLLPKLPGGYGPDFEPVCSVKRARACMHYSNTLTCIHVQIRNCSHI